MTTPQMNLDLAGRPTAREILGRIRRESRDEAEKGRWFEQLFTRVALQDPAFEIDGIWRWSEWPEREELTGLDGRDIGIDLVARRTECRWGPNAESAIESAHPRIGRIDFREHLDFQVEEEHAKRPIQEPWALQVDAIEDAVTGLAAHDRGRLVMACGTGKTFTSLRIAEHLVEDGGRILFAAPSIALVSQARREWLRQTTRPLECVVVCSDVTAGGRGEEDMRLSELECPVTNRPGRDRRQTCRRRPDPGRVLHLPLARACYRGPGTPRCSGFRPRHCRRSAPHDGCAERGTEQRQEDRLPGNS